MSTTAVNTERVLDALRTESAARPATSGDEIDGVAPSLVASPASTAEAARVMRIAAEHGLAVVARGAGTKLSWGAPPARADLVIDTGWMDRVIEHRAGDLVVHAEAGVRLSTLADRLSPAGQRLGVDPLRPPGSDAGTVGGAIATAVSGPLRLSLGAARDLLIGVTMVRADGTVAKAGGKVVKNVAGYDLGKLLTGSWGTLGLITEAVFRLHPLPALARWVVVPAPDARAAGELVLRVLHAQVVPSALEVDRAGDGVLTLAVLVEGTPKGVEARAGRLLELLGEEAALRETAPEWWGLAPWGAGMTALRLTHVITGLPWLLDALTAAAERHGLGVAVRGSPGAGVLYAGLEGGPAAAIAAAVDELRAQAAAWSGDVVVLDGPPEVKRSVDQWGPVRGLGLMRRVKDQFDPDHRLAPGRFAGGI